MCAGCALRLDVSAIGVCVITNRVLQTLVNHVRPPAWGSHASRWRVFPASAAWWKGGGRKKEERAGGREGKGGGRPEAGTASRAEAPRGAGGASQARGSHPPFQCPLAPFASAAPPGSLKHQSLGSMVRFAVRALATMYVSYLLDKDVSMYPSSVRHSGSLNLAPQNFVSPRSTRTMADTMWRPRPPPPPTYGQRAVPGAVLAGRLRRPLREDWNGYAPGARRPPPTP